MHIPAGTLPTAFGRRAVAPPEPMVDVRLTRDEVRALARLLDLDAEMAQATGDMARADRLAARAAALRECAR